MCFSIERFYKNPEKISAVFRIHFSFQAYLDFYRKRNYAQRSNNFFCRKKSMDIYIDFFASRKEASEFYAEALAS